MTPLKLHFNANPHQYQLNINNAGDPCLVDWHSCVKYNYRFLLINHFCFCANVVAVSDQNICKCKCVIAMLNLRKRNWEIVITYSIIKQCITGVSMFWGLVFSNTFKKVEHLGRHKTNNSNKTLKHNYAKHIHFHLH